VFLWPYRGCLVANVVVQLDEWLCLSGRPEEVARRRAAGAEREAGRKPCF
jgi:hypothetical protein